MTWLGDELSRIADDMPDRDLATRAMEVHQRKRRNLVALTAAAMVAVTVLAATAGLRALSTEPQPAAPPPELTTIKVGVIPTVESAPVFVALAERYFQEEGLTVRTQFINGPAFSVPLLETGRVDLAQTDYLQVFARNNVRKTHSIVAGLYQAGRDSFAVVVNAKSKIRTAGDLKRKKILVPNLRGLGPLTLDAMLHRAGLTILDVKLIEKPYPEMLDALGDGQADAAMLAEPFVTAARASKRTRDVEDLMTREFAGLPTAGMAAADRWIQQNPRTLAAFQRALAKARHLIASDPQRVRDVLPAYTGVSRATAARVAPGPYPAELDLAGLQRIADLALTYKWLQRPADLAHSVVVKEG